MLIRASGYRLHVCQLSSGILRRHVVERDPYVDSPRISEWIHPNGYERGRAGHEDRTAPRRGRRHSPRCITVAPRRTTNAMTPWPNTAWAVLFAQQASTTQSRLLRSGPIPRAAEKLATALEFRIRPCKQFSRMPFHAKHRCVLERLFGARNVLPDPPGRAGGCRPAASQLGLFHVLARQTTQHVLADDQR